MKIFYYFLIIFCFFSFLVYADEPDSFEGTVEKAQQHYLKGKELSLNGEYIKANEEFKKAEKLIDSALPHDLSGLPDSSIRKSLAEENNFSRKARNMAGNDRVKEAIAIYLEELKAQPANTDIRYNLAILYLRLAEYSKAAQEFAQVIKINPKDEEAHYNLGILYEVYLSDNTSAIHHYKEYIRLDKRAKDRKIVESWIEALGKKKK